MGKGEVERGRQKIAHPGIRKHHGRWQVRYWVNGKQRARGFERLTDAKRFQREVVTDRDRGLWLDPAGGKTLLSDWAAIWLESKVDLRPSSRYRLEGILRTHVLPEFGRISLAVISNSMVRAWVADMSSSGVSTATTRKAYNALSQMMRAATADRRIAFNPCQDVPLPAEEVHEQRFLTTDEIATLAESVGPRFRALILLGAYGGLRFGELAALRRKRLDLLRGRVTVAEALSDVNSRLAFGPPKTKGSRRVVTLPRRTVAEIEGHLDCFVAPQPDALVFTNSRGAPLRRSVFRNRHWIPATRAAGLAGLRFHDLRHTFVALWVAAGADPKEVSVRAGHSSVAFTLDRYGHLYEDRGDDVADRLDALLGDPHSPTAVVRPLR
jgi:integrase